MLGLGGVCRPPHFSSVSEAAAICTRCSSKPLREKKGGEEEYRDGDGQRKADEGLGHSCSTHFWTRPRSAKIATANT